MRLIKSDHLHYLHDLEENEIRFGRAELPRTRLKDRSNPLENMRPMEFRIVLCAGNSLSPSKANGALHTALCWCQTNTKSQKFSNLDWLELTIRLLQAVDVADGKKRLRRQPNYYNIGDVVNGGVVDAKFHVADARKRSTTSTLVTALSAVIVYWRQQNLKYDLLSRSSGTK